MKTTVWRWGALALAASLWLGSPKSLGAQEKGDGRSTARSVDLSYYGKCFTLTLFSFKSQ